MTKLEVLRIGAVFLGTAILGAPPASANTYTAAERQIAAAITATTAEARLAHQATKAGLMMIEQAAATAIEIAHESGGGYRTVSHASDEGADLSPGLLRTSVQIVIDDVYSGPMTRLMEVMQLRAVLEGLRTGVLVLAALEGREPDAHLLTRMRSDLARLRHLADTAGDPGGLIALAGLAAEQSIATARSRASQTAGGAAQWLAVLCLVGVPAMGVALAASRRLARSSQA